MVRTPEQILQNCFLASSIFIVLEYASWCNVLFLHAQDPANVDALHLLGLVFYQNGQPDVALPLIARALSTGTTASNSTTTATTSAAAAAAQQYVDQYSTDSDTSADSISASNSGTQQDDAQRANLHNSMGQCLRAVGRTQEAKAQYKLALSLQADFTVAKVCVLYKPIALHFAASFVLPYTIVVYLVIQYCCWIM
jgi:tetratricopeptide (TPR) repeat protein